VFFIPSTTAGTRGKTLEGIPLGRIDHRFATATDDLHAMEHRRHGANLHSLCLVALRLVALRLLT